MYNPRWRSDAIYHMRLIINITLTRCISVCQKRNKTNLMLFSGEQNLSVLNYIIVLHNKRDWKFHPWFEIPMSIIHWIHQDAICRSSPRGVVMVGRYQYSPCIYIYIYIQWHPRDSDQYQSIQSLKDTGNVIGCAYFYDWRYTTCNDSSIGKEYNDAIQMLV